MISKAFVLAGKAIFTIANNKGDHYTFKVTHKPASGSYRENWFISLLTGPNNMSDYTYMGTLNPNTGEISCTRSSKYNGASKPVRVAQWGIGMIWRDLPLPAGYEIKHVGKCGRCGAPLTRPDSLESGFGPECVKRV